MQLANVTVRLQDHQSGAINADLFSKGTGNTGLLLGLLAEEPAGVADFYVRYHTVQLLTALAAASSYRVQEVHTQATFCMIMSFSCALAITYSALVKHWVVVKYSGNRISVCS